MGMELKLVVDFNTAKVNSAKCIYAYLELYQTIAYCIAGFLYEVQIFEKFVNKR